MQQVQRTLLLIMSQMQNRDWHPYSPFVVMSQDSKILAQELSNILGVDVRLNPFKPCLFMQENVFYETGSHTSNHS